MMMVPLPMRFVVTTLMILSIQAAKTGQSKRFLFFDTFTNTFGQIMTGSTIYDHCNLCHNCACHFKDCSLFSVSCTLSESLVDCSSDKDVNGQWSRWSEWGKCIGTCGIAGSRRRTRTCTNPAPARCGSDCEGNNVNNKACFFYFVDIDEKTNKSCHSVPTVASRSTHSASALNNSHQPVSQATKVTPQAAQVTSRGTPAKSQSTQSVVPPSTASPVVTHPSTSSTPVSTASPLPTKADCEKICTVTAISDRQPATHVGASACQNGRKESSSALPLKCCSVGSTITSWQAGANVMANCSSIPLFTAVAAFSRGHYLTGSAGVFTGCLYDGETGFQIIRQDCDFMPNIIHVNSSQTTFYNPSEFYIISTK